MSTYGLFFEEEDSQKLLVVEANEVDKFDVCMSTLFDYKFENDKAPLDWSSVLVNLYNHPEKTKIASALTQALNMAEKRKSVVFKVLDKNLRFSSNSVTFKPKDHKLSDFLDRVFGKGTFIFFSNSDHRTIDVCFQGIDNAIVKAKALKFGYFKTKFAIGTGTQVGQQFTEDQADMDLMETYKKAGENVSYVFLKPDLSVNNAWYDPKIIGTNGKPTFPQYYSELPFAKNFHIQWNNAHQRRILNNPANGGFYLVLKQCRDVRLADPGNVEHSAYTIFPHLPDKAIHAFANLFYLHYFKENHGINVTYMCIGERQDTDLYRVNGFLDVDWYQTKMINCEKTDVDFFFSHNKEINSPKEFEEVLKQWKYITGKKIIKLYMPKNNDVMAMLVTYCVVNGFTPFMSETPHNGLIYLAQTGKSLTREQFIIAYTTINVAGIELNFMRTYHFVKRSPISVIEAEVNNEFYTYVRIKKSLFPILDKGFVIKNSSVISMENMRDVLNQDWEQHRKREYNLEHQEAIEQEMGDAGEGQNEEKMELSYPDSTTEGWQLFLFDAYIAGQDVIGYVKDHMLGYSLIPKEAIINHAEYANSGIGFLEEYSKLFPALQDNKQKKKQKLESYEEVKQGEIESKKDTEKGKEKEKEK